MIDPSRIARLAALEQAYGLPRSTLTGMWGIESNFGRAGDRPGSQFRGDFQLGNGVRSQYGITNPSDFEQSALGAAKYAADNQNFLRKSLGRDPSPQELYFAHQQGPGGALKVLSHPDDPAGLLLKPNYVTANGGDPNAPANQFYKKFEGMFNNKLGEAENGPPMALAAKEPQPSSEGTDAINAAAPMQAAMAPEGNPLSGFLENHGLARAGAALMAINNPAGAAALMSGIKDKTEDTSAMRNFKYWQTMPQGPDRDALGRSLGMSPANEETTTQKNFKAWEGMPPGPAKDAYGKAIGIEPDAPKLDKDGLDLAVQQWAESGGKVPTNMPRSQVPDVLNAGAKWAKENGLDMKDVAANGPKWAGYMTQEREFSKRSNNINIAKSELDSTLSSLNERIKALPPGYNDGLLTWNKVKQALATEQNGAVAAKLRALDEGFESASTAFARMLSNGSSVVPETSRNVARSMFNKAVSPEAVSEISSYMKTTGDRISQNLTYQRENMRAEMRGKPLPHQNVASDVDAYIKEIAARNEAQAAPAAPSAQPAPSGMPQGAKQDASGSWWAPQPNGKWRKVIITQ